MVLKGIVGQSKALIIGPFKEILLRVSKDVYSLNLYYEMEILSSEDISEEEMQEWSHFWNLCPLFSTY